MEKLLQYAWQHRFWKSPDMSTTEGQSITVLDPGWINTNAGPDFFNSKILIDGKEWAGNVEVHLKASDWYRHGHHTDRAYDSVILHVVDSADMEVKNSRGMTIPQIVIKCDDNVVALYNRLITEGTIDLICGNMIGSIPSIHLNNWIDSLAYQRIYDKSDRFRHYLSLTANDYEQALFIAIARALGFGRNSDELQLTAMSIPLRILAKHSDSLTSLEAIIFGQASLIPDDHPNPYALKLREEYRFMAHKFGLTPPASLNWNFGRIRPRNLPYRRLATLAQMAMGGFRYMSRILEASSIEELRDIFRITLSGYWATALTFDSPTGATPSALSNTAIDSLIINAAIPAIHTYGTERDNSYIVDRALDMLRSLPPENNSIIRIFTNAGLDCPDAYTSQALLQLHRVYCENRKCLFCRVGYRMLKSPFDKEC